MTTVLREIFAATKSTKVRLAMIFGALEEGGSLTGPWGVGDSGTSFGPFQIHLPAHPGVTAAQAQDPHFAVNYMLHSYEAAVRNTPDQLWASDPAKAVEYATYHAERPAVTYSASRGDSQVRATFRRAAHTLAGGKYKAPVNGVPGATNLGGSSTSGAGLHLPSPGQAAEGALGGVLGWIWSGALGKNPLSSAAEKAAAIGVAGLKRITVYGLILVGGVALVVIGAYQGVQPIHEAVDAAKDVAGKAAGAAAVAAGVK